MVLRLPDLTDKAEIAARRWATRAAVKAANRERQHTENKAEQEIREAARLQREATGKLIAQSLQRSQRKPDCEEPLAEDNREDSSDDAASEARPRVCPPLSLRGHQVIHLRAVSCRDYNLPTSDKVRRVCSKTDVHINVPKLLSKYLARYTRLSLERRAGRG